MQDSRSSRGNVQDPVQVVFLQLKYKRTQTIFFKQSCSLKRWPNATRYLIRFDHLFRHETESFARF